MARICYFGDDQELHEITIGPGQRQVTIGRHRNSRCEIVTRGQSVSRKHATVTWNSGTFLLQDLGSSNGTWYQRERLAKGTPVLRGDGALFLCGSFGRRLDCGAGGR